MEDSKKAFIHETSKMKQVTKRRYCNICGKDCHWTSKCLKSKGQRKGRCLGVIYA